MNTSILSSYGFNRNDIKVYEALLKLGRSKTGPIIKESLISSSRVYESLRILVSRGLVSYQVKNNIKYYQAESPDQLIEEAGKHIKELKTFAESIEVLPIPLPSRNEANVYEGRHGLRMAYTQHVQNMEPKEIVSIIAFVGEEYGNSPELRAFFSDTVDRVMIDKKCRGRMITNKLIHTLIKKERPDSSIYDIRYLSSRYMLPYTLNISKKEVMMSVWSDVPVVFSIKNPVVVRAFQKNFDSLWKSTKTK